MTNNQILEEIDKAMKIGKKEAYMDIYVIVSNMYTKDRSENLKKLLNILQTNLTTEEIEV